MPWLSRTGSTNRGADQAGWSAQDPARTLAPAAVGRDSRRVQLAPECASDGSSRASEANATGERPPVGLVGLVHVAQGGIHGLGVDLLAGGPGDAGAPGLAGRRTS